MKCLSGMPLEEYIELIYSYSHFDFISNDITYNHKNKDKSLMNIYDIDHTFILDNGNIYYNYYGLKIYFYDKKED